MQGYAVENAMFQWEEGVRRMRESPGPQKLASERASDRVLDQLRRRLGSTFTLDELAELYASDTDWASDLAASLVAGSDGPWIVDAAFARYAREAADYAGGRRLR